MTAARVLLGKNGLMSYDCGEPLNSQGGLYTLDNHFIKYVYQFSRSEYLCVTEFLKYLIPLCDVNNFFLNLLQLLPESNSIFCLAEMFVQS